VDCFNPKTLQATMGSVGRVNIFYTDLIHFLESTELSIYGAFMDGATVYKEEFPKKGILVLGNEAKGVSQEVEDLITKKIAIPQFGKSSTESLNVATATAILLNEIRRG
jgi:TrmH family RNA methyltransferase